VTVGDVYAGADAIILRCSMRTYAIAGASSRGLAMYGLPISTAYPNAARLVGVFDINSVRANYLSRACGGVPVYLNFDEMLEKARPDCVIVTTVDRFHHEYIIRALESGCDAITEKPMTIDEVRCRAILEAERRTGKRVTVTFNYRFAPYVTRVKELLRSGAVGRILSVDFEWFLDTHHGSDYFRRWHRRKENSGGLLVHKATHHFDMINWWLEDEPQTVFASGTRQFYGPTRSERGERCQTCIYQHTCEFFVDYASDPLMKALYFDAEKEDGYLRDRCVFAEDIDIEDSMNVLVRYRRGVSMSYSLVAHSPYEGWRVSLSGVDGRLEAQEYHSGHHVNDLTQLVKVFNRKGEVLTYDIPKAQGNHAGGDERLLERLFSGREIPDPLGHMANSWAGAMSILIGIGANKSIAAGVPVAIGDLLMA
jgi:predicted dehydrogenase